MNAFNWTGCKTKTRRPFSRMPTDCQQYGPHSWQFWICWGGGGLYSEVLTEHVWTCGGRTLFSEVQVEQVWMCPGVGLGPGGGVTAWWGEQGWGWVGSKVNIFEQMKMVKWGLPVDRQTEWQTDVTENITFATALSCSNKKTRIPSFP